MCVASIGLATSGAPAQILDFGEPDRLVLPSPTPFEELAQALEVQADGLAARGSLPLMVVYRRTLAELLRQDPLATPTRLLAAMTLANHVGAIDSVLAEPLPVMNAAQLAAFERLLRDGLERELADARSTDRWLRELMTEPAHTLGMDALPDSSGWVLDTPPDEPITEPINAPISQPATYADLRGTIASFLGDRWTDRTASRFDELAELGVLAGRFVGYAAASDRLRDRLSRAVAVGTAASLDAVAEHRSAGALIDRWRQSLATDIERLLDPDGQADALASLDRLAIEAELLGGLASLRPVPAVQTARRLAVEHLAAGAVDVDRVAMAIMLLRHSNELLDELDERTIARELRTFWRLRSRELARSVDRSARGIAGVLAPGASLADPAIIATVAASRSAAFERARFETMNTWLVDSAASRPEAAERFEPLAQVFLAIGRDLSDQSVRAEAVVRARDMLALADAARELEESITQAPETAWTRSARVAVDAWLADPSLDGDAADAVRLAVRLGDAVAGAQLLRSAARPESLGLAANASPGFELSEEVVALLAADMAADVSGTVDAFEAGRLGLVETRLDRYEREHALARLIVAIERGARLRGLEPAMRGMPELLAGPPDRLAWLAAEREDVALLCVLAECLSAGDRASASLHDRLDTLALDLLVRLAPPR